MEPIPPPDGSIPTTPPPEQPKPQETAEHPFIQRLTKEQEKIDADGIALYPPGERYSESRKSKVEEETRVFHKQETDILDADGKPTGNKRVTIVSSRPCQLRENSREFYYSIIDFETANPEKVNAGLLRVLNGFGGMVIPESDLFGREGELVRNQQLNRGVFSTIRSRIDNSTTGPAKHNEEFGVVNLVDESEQIQAGFKTAFQKSIEAAQRELGNARYEKVRKAEEDLENERKRQELLATQEAEKQRKENLPQKVLNDSMNIFDEPAVEPAQTGEQTPPVEPPSAEPTEL